MPQAIVLGPNEFSIYDSRAAVFEKLGRVKDALRDSKKVIDLGPQRWQGISKLDHALRMINLALERVNADDVRRVTEITTIRDQIQQGLQQRREHESRAFYHFGKLPLEIATTIFTMVAADDHTRVISLSQVCHNWRAAILGMPRLWSNLILTNKNPVKKAKVWAVRCQGRLIELRLRAGVAPTPWALDELASVPLDCLRALDADNFPIHEIRRRLPTFTDDVLQRLDELNIQHCADVRAASWLWRQPSMRIRDLTIAHSIFHWATAAENINQLESFTFRGPVVDTPLSDILAFLRRNPNLRKLALSMMDIPLANPGEDEEPIRLPHLSHLELEYHDFATSRIIPILDIPALSSLHIRGGIHSLDTTLRHLVHSGCAASLLELRIQRCAVSAQSIIELLRCTPSLETLQLEHVGGSQANKILESLAEPRPHIISEQETLSAVLCPSLRTVNFSHCPDIKSGTVLRLVKTRLPTDTLTVTEDASQESRPPPIVPIDTLIIDGCPNIDADILPWLRNKVRVVSCVYMTKKDARWKR
ncbi:hypothetical protein POSPLADRAFT_1042521 [Postia placenta MAD-698-R-SB12]|uniref:F-box domain-containing protein n=1 Tax=Postia placenta MAD-698-R-SB12 TaxID=670580 RepID=A0A1X6NFT5_9APHY|nr:hypothetical protein POSPLADRAFT_1042521 [Postia placenta MAD-698-R-SB12]OSX67276.1 hypothetical protein POSPLADRAFT_1042521 [Postia placenta MAD-698-R-SB12]